MAKKTTTTPTKTDAEKRAALRARIEAGEQRNQRRSLADQARSAADGALGYVKAHPLRSVAAVAVGALVLGALTRPGRRAGRKAGALGALAADAALTYGLGLLDTAGAAAGKGQERLADLGGAVGDRAKALQSAASRGTGDAADYLLRATRRSGQRAGRTIDELRKRLSH